MKGILLVKDFAKIIPVVGQVIMEIEAVVDLIFKATQIVYTTIKNLITSIRNLVNLKNENQNNTEIKEELKIKV